MADELQARWGARMRALRRDKHLSIAQLSRKTEIDQGHLSRIERGEVGTSDESRMRIASALGVRVEDLFAYPDTSADDDEDETAKAASA